MPSQPCDKYDPEVLRFLVGPAWRWKLALLLRTNAESADSLTDPLVGRAVQFLYEKCRHSQQPGCCITTDGSDIAAALGIERDDWEKSRGLQLMVLADIDVTEIGSLVGVPPDIVELWEKLFFDVRGLRTDSTWIDQFLIAPEMRYGDFEFVDKIKLALSLGPDWIRLVFDGHQATRLE
jgi:hypothetical protein